MTPGKHAAGDDLQPFISGSKPCGPRLTRAELDVGIDLGGRYLLAAQGPDGDFVYEVDWRTGEESSDNNAVRQAGATWGMALLYRETRDPAHRVALDRSLARWDVNALTGGGARRLGVVALVGLSLLERLAGPEGLKDPAEVRASLDAVCAFVEDTRLPGGGFSGRFDPQTGARSDSADPYSSGEALLLLARCGLELGDPERIARVLGWADEDYDKFVAVPLTAEADPDITKGYYQWGSMSWFELASRGHAHETWGRRLVEQALWMIDVHRTLTRRRNTGYAYEGIIPAWEWARRTGDDATARKLACVIHQGLRKLCSWQLGHPLAAAALRRAPTQFRGAVQNHAVETALRIDVTQHQVHALMYARQFGVDAAEHLCDNLTIRTTELSRMRVDARHSYTDSEVFSDPTFGHGLRYGLRLLYGLLADEFKALGFAAEVIGKVLMVTRERKQCFFYESESTFTSLMGSRLLKDKELSRTLFQRAGVSIAEGFAFRRNEKSVAFEKAKELGPAVVKPVAGHKGQGASVNVTPESFEAAWSAALRAVTEAGNSVASSNEILVEKFFAGGTEARYLVVGGRCVAVVLRIPPEILGDGISTVSQLVNQENKLRRLNPAFRAVGGMITIDDHRRGIILSQGYTLDAVPSAGARVIIDWKGGLSTGANSRGITSEAHTSMKSVAERVVNSVPGLDIAGVDILATDHSAEAKPDNYIVVEANTRPNISGHHFPLFGEPINVCRLIAENCARNMGFDVQ
jgi:D-alanine-D-alanine ligase-like ATP-grasp enzyme